MDNSIRYLYFACFDAMIIVMLFVRLTLVYSVVR